MAEVDPFDIEFAEDESKYDKPSYTGSRGGGIYKKSLKALEKERERNAVRKEYPSLTDEQADELIEMRKRNKGMLDWSEDLQRAVMTEEMKKSRPDLSDEQIQEKIDYQMAGSDLTFDDNVPPSEEQSEYDTPEREEFRKEVINKYLKQPPEGWDNMPTSEKEDFIHDLLKDVGERFFPLSEGVSDDEEIDVPEMETEVVNLPEEDVNEKEIKIDRNPTDATMAEEVEESGEDPLADFDPNSVVDPEGEYETRVSAEEAGDSPTQYPSDEEIAGIEKERSTDATVAEGEQTPDTNKKEEPAEGEKDKEEEPETEGEEDKEKEPYENYPAKEKEDKKTYEHYPVEVRLMEDALGEVNTVAGGVKDVAEKIGKQGVTSGSIANEVSRAVPHYDYRSLFR